jgi:hypothetical protein
MKSIVVQNHSALYYLFWFVWAYPLNLNSGNGAKSRRQFRAVSLVLSGSQPFQNPYFFQANH